MKSLFAARALAVAALLALAGTVSGALAQGQDFSKVEETATPLGSNIYAVTGAGGNTTVAIGSDGIIVVDTQFAPLYPKLKARIASLSPLPVKFVIDTHYHGDHTGGNASFAHDGAVIFAYKTMGDRLAHPMPSANGTPGTPAPPEALPTQSYSGDTGMVKIPGVTATLVHPAPAHTDADTIVLFKAANVIATGDIVSSASYPNIDVAAGGSIGGMIAGTDYVIAQADDMTRIVPGHGAVTNKAGVIAYRTMLVTARDRIAKLKATGMSEDQMMAANPLADLDAKWKAPGAMSARFPRLVYESVK